MHHAPKLQNFPIALPLGTDVVIARAIEPTILGLQDKCLQQLIENIKNEPAAGPVKRTKYKQKHGKPAMCLFTWTSFLMQREGTPSSAPYSIL